MTINSSPTALRRRGSAVSFTKMLASADERNFPHDDVELDSDSDSDWESSSESDSDSDSDLDLDLDFIFPPRYPPPRPLLSTIEEATEEEEEEEEGQEAPICFEFPAPQPIHSRHCRDPSSPDHPTCHLRTKSPSYSHLPSDAVLDLQQRFSLKHDGEDSAAHYLNWQTLKWVYGQSMVHGPSLLRWEAGLSAEQLPLLGRAPTRRGEVGCEEGCFEGNRFIGDDVEVGVWVVDMDEGEEPVSETSTLCGDEAGAGCDVKADVKGGEVSTRVVRTLDAHTVQILNTPHDEFVEYYHSVQQQKATRSLSSVATTPQVEAIKPACYIPAGAPRTPICTAPKPAQPLIQPSPPSSTSASATHPPTPLRLHTVRTPTPPAPSPSASPSPSPSPSVFSPSASITTKPSQESVGSEQQQLKAANLLSPCASSPRPRLSRRRKAGDAAKKCLKSVRGTVQRGVGKMGRAVRRLFGA